MIEITAKIDENTDATKRTEENTREILEIFDAVRGFVKVGGWVGNTIKWIAAVAIAGGILLYVWKTGDLPRKT